MIRYYTMIVGSTFYDSFIRVLLVVLLYEGFGVFDANSFSEDSPMNNWPFRTKVAATALRVSSLYSLVATIQFPKRLID
jgi:hypothetical protein